MGLRYPHSLETQGKFCFTPVSCETLLSLRLDRPIHAIVWLPHIIIWETNMHVWSRGVSVRYTTSYFKCCEFKSYMAHHCVTTTSPGILCVHFMFVCIEPHDTEFTPWVGLVLKKSPHSNNLKLTSTLLPLGSLPLESIEHFLLKERQLGSSQAIF